MRLIDADKMIPTGLQNKTVKIFTLQNALDEYEGAWRQKLVFDDAAKFINSQPTVDAIVISRGITNEDMCKRVFGETSVLAFDPDGKFKTFWESEYKKGGA